MCTGVGEDDSGELQAGGGEQGPPRGGGGPAGQGPGGGGLAEREECLPHQAGGGGCRQRGEHQEQRAGARGGQQEGLSHSLASAAVIVSVTTVPPSIQIASLEQSLKERPDPSELEALRQAKEG